VLILVTLTLVGNCYEADVNLCVIGDSVDVL
jgi:hypothetical protein